MQDDLKIDNVQEMIESETFYATKSLEPSSPGEKIEGYFEVDPDENNMDIKCKPNYALKAIPKAYKELYGDIESATNVIKTLKYTDEGTKKKYFIKLASLAEVGLKGKTAQPELALLALEKLKEEMVMVEGQRIKNNYMKRLGIAAAIIAAIMLAVYILLNNFSALTFLSQYLIAWIGAMAGTWVSFGARRFNFKFTQLSIIEEDMMNPAARLIYIGLCSVIFLLLLNSKIVSISIGGTSTENIAENIPMQAVIGALCGLVESRIGITIYKKAKSAITSEKA